MNLAKATNTVEDLLVLIIGVLFVIGAFVVAIGFVAGASVLSWAFVTWAWKLIPQ